MDLTSVLRDEIVFGAPASSANAMHIAFGIDANYVQPIGVAMMSILAHDSDVVFHVFSECVPDDFDAGCYRQLMAQHHSRCEWHVIDPSLFAHFDTTHYLSIATYYRFIGGEYLYERTPRFLYLDADAYCLATMRPMYERSFAEGKHLAAVPDVALTSAHLGYDDLYFNAGVLLVDTHYWREQHVSDRALELLNTQHYDLFDQDALNVLYRDHVEWLDARYNFRALDDERYPDGTTIVHYMGKHKPWKAWYWCSGSNLWEQYRQQTPWAARPLCTLPSTPSEHRFMSDLCFHRGQWLSGIGWYAKYLRLKLGKRG